MPKKDANLSDGISRLAIQEIPRIKSKNLDVITEYKKVKRRNAANFVVIGETAYL